MSDFDRGKLPAYEGRLGGAAGGHYGDPPAMHSRPLSAGLPGYRHEQVDGGCHEEPELRRRMRIERLLRRPR